MLICAHIRPNCVTVKVLKSCKIIQNSVKGGRVSTDQFAANEGNSCSNS